VRHDSKPITRRTSLSPNQTPHLYEIASGSNSLTEVTFDKAIRFRGTTLTIQWDGQHFAFGGSRVTRKGPSVIYQLDISGTVANISGTTKLFTGAAGLQFWTQGNSVVQLTDSAHVGVWNYPGGGKPSNLFKVPVHGTGYLGIAISEGPSHK
jgi:hypothetical protein